MRIFIVGAGSLGMMYGLRLARGGARITFVTRSVEQASLIAGKGGKLVEDGEEFVVVAKAVSMSDGMALAEDELPGAGDWIWITVKQAHLTDELLASVSSLSARGAAVLCLQNGIGHLPRIAAALPAGTLIVPAISTEGALRESPDIVRYTGRGTLMFGPLRPGKTNAEEEEITQKMLVSVLEEAGITAELSNQMENRIYEKLLINAVINPLTAIFGVKNGELPLHPSRLRLMSALFMESRAILARSGLNEEYGSWEKVLAVCEATAANESSMLRDVQSGRATEIDWINGGIAGLAREAGIPSPLNDAVAAMVRALH
ncbi:ketopantoate reductase family protein [Paenibacillus methanolicus]|uniref:2-dehydropantoate 2-reductase n=1 Tax=Paenibacillus methanolicus TaxID=582686 RepID=A0A5S5CFN3_9BACL|nr:2-dehydropantoate 2-reductase [Paenibacillus methanolicus]TYP77969.1 2-dehydropantoate 2-reductase [Paenibacillus methanolicus]